MIKLLALKPNKLGNTHTHKETNLIMFSVPKRNIFSDLST